MASSVAVRYPSARDLLSVVSHLGASEAGAAEELDRPASGGAVFRSPELATLPLTRKGMRIRTSRQDRSARGVL
jgi:hypothetical protein